MNSAEQNINVRAPRGPYIEGVLTAVFAGAAIIRTTALIENPNIENAFTALGAATLTVGAVAREVTRRD